jgi:hypothetical protein
MNRRTSPSRMPRTLASGALVKLTKYRTAQRVGRAPLRNTLMPTSFERPETILARDLLSTPSDRPNPGILFALVI